MSVATVPQVRPEHDEWSAYSDRRRWASYWYQIDEVLKVRPRRCLVVGPGDNTVVDALRRAGVCVTSCEIDPALHPDAVADVRRLPFVWELGARNYPRDQVERSIRSVFRIERQYQVPENPFHRFDILSPREP